MKTFRCTCGNTLYFENTVCVQCDRKLGFLPEELVLSAFEPDRKGRFVALAPEARGHHYRKCRNYAQQDACNWMVAEEDPNPYCAACRLNQVIPNLDKPGNRERWLRVEKRKRRLIYDLRRHRLPLVGRDLEPQTGLAFAFMEDDPSESDDSGLEFQDHHEGMQIMTGHANGLITINIAEADDVQRERMRVAMNEAQRTLLGHFRHESGHYYWDRLVRNGPLLGRVRELFGDERENYQDALGRYYNEGAEPGWQDNFVSAYASSHPWEDWAECWAHLRHGRTHRALGQAGGEHQPAQPQPRPARPLPVRAHADHRRKAEAGQHRHCVKRFQQVGRASGSTIKSVITDCADLRRSADAE